MKSALNRVLTLPDYRSRRELLESSGILDLGTFCVELWLKQVSYRILVPMSYISWLDISGHLKCYRTRNRKRKRKRKRERTRKPKRKRKRD